MQHALAKKDFASSPNHGLVHLAWSRIQGPLRESFVSDLEEVLELSECCRRVLNPRKALQEMFFLA